MLRQAQLEGLARLSSVLGISDNPLSPNTVDIDEDDLIKITDQLKQLRVPSFLVGKRPRFKRNPSEKACAYRLFMSRYVLLNTGIKLPIRSNISARFYNEIVNYIEKGSSKE